MVLVKLLISLLCIFVIASEAEFIQFDYKLGKSMYNEPFDIGRYVVNIAIMALSLVVTVIMWL